MIDEGDRSSRRAFVNEVSRLAIAVPLAACASAPARESVARPVAVGEWDLSWVDRLAHATDRAVFDWPNIGDAGDPVVMQLAARYLANCDAVYGAGKYRPGVVLNIRTTTVPAGLNDGIWSRYALGAEANVKDPGTQQPAVRNQFWRRPAGTPVNPASPTLEEMVQRGAIVLVCDFALGHLANRLAAKANRAGDDVHRELRASLVPTAIAVPSGIYGLAKSQNAGCALIRI